MKIHWNEGAISEILPFYGDLDDAVMLMLKINRRTNTTVTNCLQFFCQHLIKQRKTLLSKATTPTKINMIRKTYPFVLALFKLKEIRVDTLGEYRMLENIIHEEPLISVNSIFLSMSRDSPFEEVHQRTYDLSTAYWSVMQILPQCNAFSFVVFPDIPIIPYASHVVVPILPSVQLQELVLCLEGLRYDNVIVKITEDSILSLSTVNALTKITEGKNVTLYVLNKFFNTDCKKNRNLFTSMHSLLWNWKNLDLLYWTTPMIISRHWSSSANSCESQVIFYNNDSSHFVMKTVELVRLDKSGLRWNEIFLRISSDLGSGIRPKEDFPKPKLLAKHYFEEIYLYGEE
jgi:hypothetical protein